MEGHLQSLGSITFIAMQSFATICILWKELVVALSKYSEFGAGGMEGGGCGGLMVAKSVPAEELPVRQGMPALHRQGTCKACKTEVVAVRRAVWSREGWSACMYHPCDSPDCSSQTLDTAKLVSCFPLSARDRGVVMRKYPDA